MKSQWLEVDLNRYLTSVVLQRYRVQDQATSLLYFSLLSTPLDAQPSYTLTQVRMTCLSFCLISGSYSYLPFSSLQPLGHKCYFCLWLRPHRIMLDKM